MANQTTDDKITYILTVFKHTSLPKPDYNAVAQEAGINTGQNAQRRLKAIVKAAGFDLINDQIVGPDGTTGGGEPVGTPAKKGRAKKSPVKKVANGESPTKKRKLSESVVDSTGEEDDGQVKAEAVEEVKKE